MDLPRPLLLVMALFVAACIAFNLATPYRQPGQLRYQKAPDPVTGQLQPVQVPDVGAPDERQHANYIAHLRSGKGFPVLVPGSPDLGETYQSHQPPLYYILATAWSAATAADPTEPDAGFRLRFLNTLIGLATLLGVYFGAKWGLGRPDIGVAAAAFAGLLPMSVALHSAVSNDPLLYAFCAWGLALALKGLQQGWDNRTALATGVVLGAALLTKTTALALFPVVLIALALAAKTHGARPTAAQWTLALALPLLIAAPWLARNISLYGDPFALAAFNAAFTGSPQASLFIEGLGPTAYWLNMVLWWTARSFVGAFGYMDIFLFESLDPDRAGALYLAVLLLLAVPILLGQLNLPLLKLQNDQDALPEPSRFQILHLALLAVVTLLFVRFNMQYFQGQARYLFPALPSFAYLVALGARRIAAPNPDRAWLVVTLPLLALTTLAYLQILESFPLRTPPT